MTHVTERAVNHYPLLHEIRHSPLLWLPTRCSCSGRPSSSEA